MKESDKNLLIKDLCSRIPYDTVVYVSVNGIGDAYLDSVDWYEEVTVRDYRTNTYPVDDVKPYLRPMSSMTEEEKYTYRHMLGATLNSEGESIMFVYVEDFSTVVDWLNANHFDYRGLIPMGLALEAPEGMYN